MSDASPTCRKCGKTFPSREAYGKHVRKVHGGRAPWGPVKLAVATVALVVVAGGIAALAWQASQPEGPVDVEQSFSLSRSPRLGSDEAPVKLFAFESPQCSSCRFFHVGDGRAPSLYERIVAEYVETGKVQYVEKTFFVGYPWERTAALAQKCVWRSDPERFHDLTTAYYVSQDRINEANLMSFLDQWAVDHGVDAAALRECVESRRHADEVGDDVAEGRRAGARGTPTFIVVGPDGGAKIIAGPQPYNVFRAAFEDALVA